MKHLKLEHFERLKTHENSLTLEALATQVCQSVKKKYFSKFKICN